jgi:hypothetical protein
LYEAKIEKLNEHGEAVANEHGEVELETRNLTPSPAADLRGLVGASENGEYVYFVAGGALASGATSRTCVVATEQHEVKEETEGRLPAGRGCNLYVYHEGVTRFIGAVSARDNEPNQSVVATTAVFVADWAVTASQRTAEVSPDGQYAAFGSHIALTGVHDSGPEIFMYDFAAARLFCVSCSPDGESNSGATTPPLADAFGTQRQRDVLDDGRVFFTSQAALVPQDTNGQDDVYEWENGEVHLVSSGTSDSPSILADASEDGSNVFFTTAQALVPEDKDEIVDMYDARVDGGFPAPVVATPCGGSEECQGAVPVMPTLEAPTSTTFSGAGNVGLAAEVGSSPVTHHALTRAQKLARALKACRKDRSRHRRSACDKEAKRQYGPPPVKHATRRRRTR